VSYASLESRPHGLESANALGRSRETAGYRPYSPSMVFSCARGASA
jgi:hypothetical protein